MIRAGTRADLGAAVRMAKDFHLQTPMKGLPFVARRAAQMFIAALENPDALVLILDLDGPHGAIIMEKARYPLGDTVFAKEVIFWIDPEFRGRWWREMIRGAESWAALTGAQYAALSCFHDNRTVKIFERAGYVPTEISTMKELQWRSLRH